MCDVNALFFLHGYAARRVSFCLGLSAPALGMSREKSVQAVFLSICLSFLPLDLSPSAKAHGGQVLKLAASPRPVKLGPRTTAWTMEDIAELAKRLSAIRLWGIKSLEGGMVSNGVRKNIFQSSEFIGILVGIKQN